VNAQNNKASSELKEQQSLDGAHNAVTNAEQSEAASKLRDEQSVAQARGNVTSSEQSLQATLAGNAVKSAPPTRATVVSAETSVESAGLSVENARETLSQTVLHAPAAGVVASIGAKVGQTVSGTGGSTGSGSSTSAGASGASEGASGGGTSAAGTRGSGSSGGTSASSGAGTGASSGGGTGSGVSNAGSTGTGKGGGAASSGSGDPSSNSSSGSASSSASGASSSASSGSSSSGSSSSGSSSSKSFIELTELQGFQLVVPLSESEIVQVHVGQLASVTIEALEGRKFAAHVVAVAVLSTSNSGVVSYDVTFQLDQSGAGIKPGMSASAEVVVDQAEGVNVPTSAISGGAVTVMRDGKPESRRVVTGLAGNSSTIILGGLKAGEEVALPIASASSSSATNVLSRLAGRGGGLGGALGGGLGGGGLGLRGGG